MRRTRHILSVLLLFGLLLGSVGPLAAQDGGSTTYVVQPGENLFRIALRFNTTVESILAANGLANADMVVAGQTLVIPNGVIVASAPPAPAPASAPATGTSTVIRSTIIHTVAPGESIYSIGRQYQVSVAAMLTTNNLANPSVILVGQQLTIPLPAGSIPPAVIGPLPEDDPNWPINLGELPPPLPDSTLWPLTMDIFSTGGPNVREIFRRGQALGNNPRAFSKIGDCNSELPFFLGKFDRGEYNLGPYGYLQPAIDHFAGSWERQSMSVWTGNHVWAVLDPIWANPAYCQSGETPLACEFRIHRPSVVLIRLGTNEAGSSALFEENLRKVVDFSIERGVIPVLGTKADTIEGNDLHNTIIRQVAADYHLPLWDFARAAEVLPNRGLQYDGIHLTWAAFDYGLDDTLRYGHPVHNLTTLMMLDMLWRDVLWAEENAP